MKSRYCYCPMTARRIGRRVTLFDRLRKWQRQRAERRNAEPDLFLFSDFNRPVYPGK